MGQGVRLDVPRAAFGWATAYVLKDRAFARFSFATVNKIKIINPPPTRHPTHPRERERTTVRESERARGWEGEGVRVRGR